MDINTTSYISLTGPHFKDLLLTGGHIDDTLTILT